MKETKRQNPYATVSGAPIQAPHTQKGTPKATVRRGDDLRVKK